MAPALQPIRLVSIGAFGAWLLLTALAYRQIPYFDRAWAANLLQYLPEWSGWLLVLLGLLVATEEARGWMIGLARAIGSVAGRVPRPMLDVLLLCLVASALFMLRDRHGFGFGDRLMLVMSSSREGMIPGGGAGWLMQRIVRTGMTLGMSGETTVQLANCIFGGAAVVLVTRASRALGGGAAGRAIPLLVFSAGLLRAVGGRVDVQPAFIAAAALCLLLALENLRGRGQLAWTALAFGVTASLDPLGRFLLPGLVATAWLSTEPTHPSHQARAAARALGLALVPLALHATLLLAGTEPDTDHVRAALFGRGGAGWVRGFSQIWRSNTDYSLLSQPHLKYVGNSMLLLAPATLPLLFGFAIVRRGRIATSSATRLLSVSCASLIVGSCLLRPGAGPFDWKMLSVTALFLAFFVGALLAEVRNGRLRRQLAAAAVGLQLLFFGVPFSAIAFGATHDAGPFVEDAFPGWTPYAPGRAPPLVARWL